MSYSEAGVTIVNAIPTYISCNRLISLLPLTLSHKVVDIRMGIIHEVYSNHIKAVVIQNIQTWKLEMRICITFISHRYILYLNVDMRAAIPYESCRGRGY